MKYAIIKNGSRQYKVSVGDKVSIEKSSASEGSVMTFDQVLMVVDGDKVEIGTPTVKDVVSAKVLSHTKDKKVRVATYKAKSRLRRVKGHRHQYTKVEITAIGKAETPKATKPTSKEAAKSPAKKPVAKKA